VGAEGENVRVMQNYLNALAEFYPDIPKLSADGVFGPGMESAVKVFQQGMGLEANGIIDVDTWQAISDSYWNLTNRQAMISAMGRVIAGRMIFG
jgi:peptidoglycan hydrolase-like protein with peptidoglycan-binding domain